MIEFVQRASGIPRRLGILPGTFNPPTLAHIALARAALAQVDEVLFVLPREFPHKPYQGATFDSLHKLWGDELDKGLVKSPYAYTGAA